jgi:PLP dependent protein
MDYSFVAERAERVRARIAEAAARAGRAPEAVEILAVTKFHPLEALEAAWTAGFRAFGESRVQEAEEKIPSFIAAHPGARVDMIGHLQSNKAKRAVLLFSRIQSADSASLLLELDSRASAAIEAGRPRACREVLLELHTGESSKEGFESADLLYRALEALLSRPGRALEPRGLMTMAPLAGPAGARDAEGERAVRSSFRSLRAAMEGARLRFGLGSFDQLSMGMSDDFEAAVEEGSTSLRIGTAIFGTRSA